MVANLLTISPEKLEELVWFLLAEMGIESI